MANNFGKVVAFKAEVGGKTCRFRSKMEYRYAVWLQMQKEQGLVADWHFEHPDAFMEVLKASGNKAGYLPDFMILTNDGDYEIHETKGYFKPSDYTKMKLAAQQGDKKITLIFANLTNCKSSRAQYNRAKKLEPHLHRLILDANETIFKKISFLFQY